MSGDLSGSLEQVNRWLARGDGIAVYENHDMGHPELGHRQYVSYGSSVAMLPTDNPPQRLPDIGGRINWRYSLVAKYRGVPVRVEEYDGRSVVALGTDGSDEAWKDARVVASAIGGDAAIVADAGR